MARPRVSSTGPTTNRPSQRRSRRVDRPRKTAMTNEQPTSENSYMLPSGGRSTDRPLSTVAAMSSRAPSHDRDIPMPAALRRRGTSATSPTAPDPAAAPAPVLAPDPGPAGAVDGPTGAPALTVSAVTGSAASGATPAGSTVAWADLARSMAKAIMARVNTAMA